jgi:hypothetical protein
MSFEQQDIPVRTTKGLPLPSQGSETLPKLVFSASVLKEGIGVLKPIVSTKNLSIEDLERKLAQTKNLILRKQIEQQIDEIKEPKIKVGAFTFNRVMLDNFEQESTVSDSNNDQWDQESEEEDEPFAKITENTSIHTNKDSKDAKNEELSAWNSFTTGVEKFFNPSPKTDDSSIEMVRMNKRKADVEGNGNHEPVTVKRINNTLVGQNEATDLNSTLKDALAKRRKDVNRDDDESSGNDWDSWDKNVVTTNNIGSYRNYSQNNDDIIHPAD